MGYNEAIVNSPVVVFAGAGASAHLGYPCGEAVRKALTQYVKGELYFVEAKDSRRAMFQAWEIANTPAQTFEDVFDGLEALVRAEERGVGGDVVAHAKRVWERCRQCILSEFGERLPPDGPVSPAWKALVKVVHPGHANILPIFTTNYDFAFDRIADELLDDPEVRMDTPFDRSAARIRDKKEYWRPQHLDQASPKEGVSSAIVMHLHGCVSWHRGEDAEGGLPFLRYGDDGSPLRAAADKALIWPTRKKTPFEDPFWTHHCYLQRCLEACKTVLFIGYGFWDDTVIAALRRAAVVNDAMRVLILDSDSERQGTGRLLCHVPHLGGRTEYIESPFGPEAMAVVNSSRSTIGVEDAWETALSQCGILSLLSKLGPENQAWDEASPIADPALSYGRADDVENGLSQAGYLKIVNPGKPGVHYVLQPEVMDFRIRFRVQVSAPEAWCGMFIGATLAGHYRYSVFRNSGKVLVRAHQGKHPWCTLDTLGCVSAPQDVPLWVCVEKAGPWLSVLVQTEEGDSLDGRCISLPEDIVGYVGFSTSGGTHTVSFDEVAFIPDDSPWAMDTYDCH